nr:MerR family transcriptional regulator [Priestia aryabhattai]MDH3135371.1 MerR family transcriptional regulator [Priestia aryabhattai]
MSETNNFVYKTGEVLKRLDLKDSVFKKYIFSLEKEGYFFRRNNLGHRLFTEDDIKALEMFLKLISYDGMTIESVARKIGMANKKELEPTGHEGIPETGTDGHDIIHESGSSSHDAMSLMNALLKEQEQRFVRLLQEQEQTFKNEIQAIKNNQTQEVHELKKTLLERIDEKEGNRKKG